MNEKQAQVYTLTQVRCVPSSAYAPPLIAVIGAFRELQLRLDIDVELFCFGRPLFKILEQYSLRLQEENGRYTLAVADSPLPPKCGEGKTGTYHET